METSADKYVGYIQWAFRRKPPKLPIDGICRIKTKEDRIPSVSGIIRAKNQSAAAAKQRLTLADEQGSVGRGCGVWSRCNEACGQWRSRDQWGAGGASAVYVASAMSRAVSDAHYKQRAKQRRIPHRHAITINDSCARSELLLLYTKRQKTAAVYGSATAAAIVADYGGDGWWNRIYHTCCSSFGQHLLLLKQSML